MNDLISRQAAIEALKREEALTRAFGYHVVIDTIRELPSAQPEPIKINIDDFNKEDLERFKKELGNTPITVLPAQPDERMLHESCTDCPLYDKDRHSCPRFNKVIPVTLRELQSAQPEQRWIPVNKELPKKDGEYLVTVGGEATFPDVDTAWFYYGHWIHQFGCTVKVIAWMPLPEPYNAESEDKE